MPQQTNSPSTNVVTTVVTSSNAYDLVNPILKATNFFTVIVREVNMAPVLPFIADQTVNELTLLTVTNTATQPNIHSSLFYSLVDPPAGMSIDTNGIISWTPSEAQGPSTNLITVAIDSFNQWAINFQTLSVTNTFTVVVNEINVPPVLPAQTNLAVAGLTRIVITNTATDPDIPANVLSYQLAEAPAGASIDTNGIIAWTPAPGQVPSTNVFTTVVTDFNPWAVNEQHLSATNTFLLVVLGAPPVIESIVVTGNVVTLTWSALPGRSYRIQYADTLVEPNWNDATPDVNADQATATASYAIGDSRQRFYRVLLLP
jgi:hypothetical protein